MPDGTTYDRLLRLRQVCDCTSLSASTVYRRVEDGAFPAPVRLGGTVRWRESEVQGWIRDLPRGAMAEPAVDAAGRGGHGPKRGRGRPRKEAAPAN